MRRRSRCIPDRSIQSPLAKRRGIATVEAAVSLPVLVLICLGTLETAGVIFTKQALQTAAQECGREAAKPNSTLATIQQVAQEFADRRSIENIQLSISPADPTGLPAGTTITVTLSVDPDSVGFVGRQFLDGPVGASNTVVKSF